MAITPPTLQQGSNNTILLSGAINFETIMPVYYQGLTLLDQKSEQVVVDLRGVLQGDSSILALLSAWIRYTMAQQKKIILINLPESLQHLMQLSGLGAIFPVKE